MNLRNETFPSQQYFSPWTKIFFRESILEPCTWSRGGVGNLGSRSR